MHHFLWRTGVHVFKAVLQCIQFFCRDQVRLADKNLVGKTHLATRFLAVIELLGGVLGVYQGQYRVEQKALSDLVVHEEGLRHWAWVSQTCGFDDHAFKIEQAFALFGCQELQGGAQVFTDGAAHAAVVHLDDLLVGVRDQDFVVDVFFTELVFNDGNFLAMGFGQDALEQGGFACA